MARRDPGVLPWSQGIYPKTKQTTLHAADPLSLSLFLLVCHMPCPCNFPCHIFAALKCDLREDRAVKERLQRFNGHPVQYDEGLAVARRIRASRYLGKPIATVCDPRHLILSILTECSSKHNRGVNEVFYEAARVSLGTSPKGSSSGCLVM